MAESKHESPARRPVMVCNPSESGIHSNVTYLPRGGLIVDTKAGPIQFGV